MDLITKRIPRDVSVLNKGLLYSIIEQNIQLKEFNKIRDNWIQIHK